MQEQCIWAIGNISADSQVNRDLLLKEEALVKMVRIYQKISHRPCRVANWLWAMSNLVRGSPPPAFPLVSHSLPYFLHTLMSPLD